MVPRADGFLARKDDGEPGQDRLAFAISRLTYLIRSLGEDFPFPEATLTNIDERL